MNSKLVFNVTFHQQIEALKFHLSNLLAWSLSSEAEFVFACAHKENLQKVKEFVSSEFPKIKAHYIFVSEDLGYHKGTFENIRKGIIYIEENLDYDYIVNVEADNMFWSEEKFNKIIQLMIANKKHLLLIPEGGPSNLFRNNWPNAPSVMHITTLNIFSKYFINKYMPLEINEKYYDLGWCGQCGTPFEAYFIYCINDKFELDTEQKQWDHYNSIGLRLEYDYTRIVYPGWYSPDNLVPDKFIKWGIVNCLSTAGGRIRATWESVIEFINLHGDILD